MRTFFIVFLPYIALFLAAALVGIAILWIGYRLVTNVLIPYRRAKLAQVDKIEELRQWQSQAEFVFADIVNAEWEKQPTGTYQVQLPAEVCDKILKYQNPYRLVSGRKSK